ncbi:hypothetical protein [Streptomyces cupreus]|uniref:Uncharacterized protein n=1 Tax=Streptomyces cupreus TaxID=2759956 RepID=A0A7X1J4E8_9ACTN|nr:hypothetical protein [Streptomyces cupreus]MBC2904001.1 hypothetical protein [Streptomyces cupreus]
MPKQLTTQNATITTAAVEMKTLTVSGKQVTLAVFRQLIKEPLVADDGTLNGSPWGTVNYHPDKCEAETAHWHIVWQKGTELRRAYVNVAPKFDYIAPAGHYQPRSRWYTSTAANQYLTALVYMGLKAGDDPLLAPRPRRSYGHPDETDTYLAELELPAELSRAETFPVLATVAKAATDAADLSASYRAAQAVVDRGLSEYESTTSPDWRAKAIAQRQETAQHYRQKYDEAMAALRVLIERRGGFDAISDTYAAEIDAEEGRRQRHRDARATLAELPQLFIAV